QRLAFDHGPRERREVAVALDQRAELERHLKSIPRFSMNAMTSGNPCPVFRLVNTNGRSPRILRASRSMTSSEAPTIGAKSILLITSRSDLVIPGPPLRGILSPAATSMT